LKPEQWGSPLVQEKYQEEKACDKRHPYRIIITIIIIIIIIMSEISGKLSVNSSNLFSCGPSNWNLKSKLNIQKLSDWMKERKY